MAHSRSDRIRSLPNVRPQRKRYRFHHCRLRAGRSNGCQRIVTKKKKVCILEWGDNDALTGNLWYGARTLLTPGRSLLFTSQLLGMVRGVTCGGSTVHYYATCYPVSDRDDDVKVVMDNLIRFTISRSMCKFCTYLILVQFTLFKNVIDMLVITDRSRPNSSCICAWVSQAVSSRKCTARLVRPSAVWYKTISPRKGPSPNRRVAGSRALFWQAPRHLPYRAKEPAVQTAAN
jgi:hypothetical protein